jgi:hypothetical protein
VYHKKNQLSINCWSPAGQAGSLTMFKLPPVPARLRIDFVPLAVPCAVFFFSVLSLACQSLQKK